MLMVASDYFNLDVVYKIARPQIFASPKSWWDIVAKHKIVDKLVSCSAADLWFRKTMGLAP